ncbi:MAG: hypothetical protein AB7G93_07020 [Bdellovibrionales bacterium]
MVKYILSALLVCGLSSFAFADDQHGSHDMPASEQPTDDTGMMKDKKAEEAPAAAAKAKKPMAAKDKKKKKTEH